MLPKLNSIRVGGIAARARDERIAIEYGVAGQETTGPAGAAMALRILPAILEHAKLAETIAPDAWFINFTNPAGLITQTLSQHTKVKVIGICDTPAERAGQIVGAERQSYTMAVVRPRSWSATAGITGVARTTGAAIAPLFAGFLSSRPALMSTPFFIAGAPDRSNHADSNGKAASSPRPRAFTDSASK